MNAFEILMQTLGEPGEWGEKAKTRMDIGFEQGDTEANPGRITGANGGAGEGFAPYSPSLRPTETRMDIGVSPNRPVRPEATAKVFALQSRSKGLPPVFALVPEPVAAIEARSCRWLIHLPHENIEAHFHPAATRAEVLRHPRYGTALDLEPLPEGFDTT